MTSTDWAQSFTTYAISKLRQNLQQILRCAGLLNPAELWSRENEHCNSVGNLILHLTGNVRQWIVGGVDGRPYERDRPAEFAQRGPLPPAEICAALRAATEDAVAIIAGLDAGRLAARHAIQSYSVTALEAVFHVVEHYSFHTGQIVHRTKVLRDVDLSLYDAQGHKPAGERPSP